MHEKFYGLLAPRTAKATPISDNVWLDTVCETVHVYAFIMLMLDDANKINTFATPHSTDSSRNLPKWWSPRLGHGVVVVVVVVALGTD